jgi:hypothetical protein
LFRKATSKKELLYIGIVVGLTVVFFSTTQSILWLYLMAFLLFLTGFIFGKPTKKNILVDSLGFILLCLVFTVGEYLF